LVLAKDKVTHWPCPQQKA